MKYFATLLFFVLCVAFTFENQPNKTIPVIQLEAYKQIINNAKSQNKTLLINFWATWCKPCIQEMPYLIKAADSLGINAVFISIDDVKNLESVSNFIQNQQWHADFKLIDLTDFDAFIDFTNPDWQGEIPMTQIIHNNKTGSHFATFHSTQDVLKFITSHTN